jgi:hypothetical protein
MRCIADAARRRLENQHNEYVWLAWNTAALSRSREKRLPSMSSLMIKQRGRRTQSWEEQMRICEQIAVIHGGST